MGYDSVTGVCLFDLSCRLIELDLGQAEVLQQSDVAIIRIACRQVAALASEVAAVRRSCKTHHSTLLVSQSVHAARACSTSTRPSFFHEKVESLTVKVVGLMMCRSKVLLAARSCSRSSRHWKASRHACTACSKSPRPHCPRSSPS